MRTEILFHTSSTPKVIDAAAVYTKAGLLCVEWVPDAQGRTLITKYPLVNVFSVSHYHGTHLGTGKQEGGGGDETA